MQHIKSLLLEELRQTLADISFNSNSGTLAVFENSKSPDHGDLAITAALQLSKEHKVNPRILAERIISSLLTLPAFQAYTSKLEVAGPGFINIHLNDSSKQSVVHEVLNPQNTTFYGHKAPTGQKALVEFVSANPTGPLHIGHGRQAALGDAICNLWSSQGWQVHREFFYNDAGTQIQALADSVYARLHGHKPNDADWPVNAYNGDYIADIANDFHLKKSVISDGQQVDANGDINDIDNIRQFAVAYLRCEQDKDLTSFNLRFDNYYLESSLYSSGQMEDAVQRLITNGKTYEKDGALWLKSTEYGDDKDRVMRKSDGSYTYFVPDVAYHISKWDRGYNCAINIQGSDHHGTIARVRAGLQAVNLGIPIGYPEYILHTMVRVVKDGQEVKISKRSGSYITLRDLIDWTSKDAVRFFLLSRKPDTEYTFDVDLAVSKNSNNPVYYIQYAHARICSIIRRWQQESGGDISQLPHTDLRSLNSPVAQKLLLTLSKYPDVLENSAKNCAPHEISFYLRELAGVCHNYYDNERILVEGDASTTQARLALISACASILRDGLSILGVSAPQEMH